MTAAGRNHPVSESDRIRWANATVLAGWMFVLAYLTYLVTQIRRAAATTQASFEDGIWGQRIEEISFATLPQNVVILIPGVVAVVVGAVLTRSVVDPVVVRLRRVVRVIAGLSIVVVAVGVVGIVAVFFRNYDSVGDTAAILGRLGGIAMATAAIRLCLEAAADT